MNQIPKDTLDKKFVLITGCSSGIGYCLATGLHKRGYDVIASCRTPEDTTKISELGIPCLTIDLDNSQSIQAGIAQTLELSKGNLYALINNGAYGQPGAVEDLSRDVLRSQFETNVFGTQELTNGFISTMRKTNQGRIIQISSVLGFVCLKFRGAYNASKYALEALTDTMRLEFADSNIKFSLIEPGPITSEFRENALKKFHQNINPLDSVHRDAYQAVEQRLTSTDPIRFCLPADAVLKSVIHALESPNPKIRYRVTVPTNIFAWLKRILPDRLMDRLLSRS